MRYFLDTEFIENGPKWPLQLISIGIVDENRRSYYAISSEFSPSDANDWVQKNVIPQLDPILRKPLKEITQEIISFIGDDEKPEFWGYYADYDWVVFCQLFGTMMDLPKRFPKYCRDIKQWCDELGNPTLPKLKKGEHNALVDARWNKFAWEFLRGHFGSTVPPVGP